MFGQPPQSGLKRLTPTSNFFHTPNTPADPWDCNRYPNSPYCDANPLRKSPAGYELELVLDECNIGIQVTPILGYIALPTQQFVYRKSECIRPPTKTYKEDEPLHIPPPKGSGIYCLISKGRYYRKTHDRSPIAQPIELEIAWNYSKPDGIYPIGDRYPNNIRGDFWVENEGFHKYTENGNTTYFDRNKRYQSIVEDILLNFTIPLEQRQQNTTRVFLTEIFGAMFGIIVGVIFFRYEEALETIKNNSYFRNRSSSEFVDREIGLIDGREVSSRIQWDVYELGVDSFSVPPPPKKRKKKDCCEMACCTQNDQLLRLILKRIGNFPVSVPASYLTVDDKQPVEKRINSLMELTAWFAERFDEVIGEFEIKIEIDDADLSKEGKQRKTIRLPNLAEVVAELFTMQFQQTIYTDLIVHMLTNNLVEAGQIKQMGFKNHNALMAITEYMGFPYKNISQKLPLTFTPGKGTFEELLKETQVDVSVIDYVEKKSMAEDIQTLLQAAAIIRAVFYRRAPNDKETLKQQLIEDLTGLVGERVGGMIDIVKEFVEDLGNQYDPTETDQSS
ncbi:MAG TPA: hypothetical protein IGS40_07790 [Trichormus sp. M33_DOE_039]|nr:hypothetical protein [Trichormus sp. M33_DOE_039]